jgi:hypothetical protein
MRPPYPLIFFCSFITLSFEILLIRIFSIRLSYHYASLIISLSMAGLVIGSLLVFFKQKTILLYNLSSSKLLRFASIALAVSCPAIFLLLSFIPLDHVRMLWEKIQVVYLVIFILFCTIPFFLYGIFISSALLAWRDRANKVYASDLVGGAGGILLVVMLMNAFKIEYVLVIMTVVMGTVILSGLERAFSRIVIGSILYGLCLIIVLDVSAFKISPYKGLSQALKDDGARHVTTIYSSHSRLDLFENSRMKFAPGLSLSFREHIPRGLGMALDGEIAGVVMDRKDLAAYDFLSYVPSALPYLLIQPESVVIIGARNSIDLLQPSYFGASRVSIAEHDTSVIKALASQRESLGPIQMPVFPGSGRNLLRNLPQNLGLIFLSRTGFFPSGSFGLQEDYDLTIEAITTYMKWLKDNGVLFIQMFLLPPPRIELRLARNIKAALKKMGIQEVDKYLLIYRSWDTVNFLIKRDGFSESDFSKVSQFLANRQFDLLYPDIVGQEKFITGLDYQGLFHEILADKSSVEFSSSYTFDIRETTDDRPFFHYFLRLSKIGEVYRLSGRKWAYFLHEGMSLPFVLIFLIFLAICIFGIALILSRNLGSPLTNRHSELTPGSLLYFALIGFAFMFVEVFFIHRLILPFGSPVKAFSITLVTILMSAGIGSLLAGLVVGKKMMWIIGMAPLSIFACYFLFDLVDETALSAVFMVPIGIVLGFFFPVGLRFLVREKTGGVPLAYAANGAASIIAPSLASVVAVAYGCNILLILAALLYILAIVIILLVMSRISRASEYL